VLGPLVGGLVGTDADVLDTGCGTGFCARLLAEQCYRVVGVDASEEMLDVARERAPDVKFVRGTRAGSTGSARST